MRARIVTDVNGRVHRQHTIAHSPCGKQAYTSRKLAATAAAQARKATDGDDIRAYRCIDGCHCWHIGHRPWWAR